MVASGIPCRIRAAPEFTAALRAIPRVLSLLPPSRGEPAAHPEYLPSASTSEPSRCDGIVDAHARSGCPGRPLPTLVRRRSCSRTRRLDSNPERAHTRTRPEPSAAY